MAREIPDALCSGGKGDDWVTNAISVEAVERPMPSGKRQFMTYLIVRTSQECGSSAAEALKSQDFFASQKSFPRCDDLLTMTVDKPPRAGL